MLCSQQIVQLIRWLSLRPLTFFQVPCLPSAYFSLLLKRSPVLLLGVSTLLHAQAVALPPVKANFSASNAANVPAVIQTENNGHHWDETLPTMTTSDGLIDAQNSLMVGEWALRQINANAPLLDDPWLQQSMEQIVWQINAVARQNAPLALAIINDKQINAFAVPSGLIGINVGLLDKARSLDEMASVIAHEIAHVSQRHYQHRQDEKTKQLLMQMGGIVAGVAAAKSGESNAGAAVMMGTQAMSANTAAAFSRSQEREADRVGMQIMAQAGYDVSAMPSFFAMLDQQHPMQPNAFIPSFVMSHPLTAERLSEARARAASYPQQFSNHSTITNDNRKQLFEQIQWRARYLAHLTNKAELSQAAKTNQGAKLALASLLIDERQYAEADKVLQAFHSEIADLSNPLAVITMAKLNAEQGKTADAITQLTQLANLLPERRDLNLYLADIYLNQPANAEYAQQVLNRLQPLSRRYPRDIAIWQRLQQASQILAKLTQGDTKILHEVNVLRYRANREFWQNQLTDAVTSLTQAQQLAQQLSHRTAIVASLNQQLNQVQEANKFKPT